MLRLRLGALHPAVSIIAYGIGIAGCLKLHYWWRQARAAAIEEEPVVHTVAGETQEEKKLFTRLIRIPQSSVGIVLGRHGKMIRSIALETQTFLGVFHYNPNQYARDNKKTEVIEEESWDQKEIQGPSSPYEYAFVKVQAYKESQFKLVRLRIRGLVEDSKIERVTDVMEVPKMALGWIIGRGGSNIKRINDMCHVRIQITQINSQDQSGAGEYESIHISGRVDCVDEAKNQIHNAVSKWRRLNGNGEQLESFDEDLMELMAMKEELEQPETLWE